MHWKLCLKDHDCTGTHRTLPEEGCNVKEDISLHSYAFLEINNIYILLWIWSYICGCDLYLELFFNVVNTILTCLMSWENCIKSMLNQLVVQITCQNKFACWDFISHPCITPSRYLMHVVKGWECSSMFCTLCLYIFYHCAVIINKI